MTTNCISIGSWCSSGLDEAGTYWYTTTLGGFESVPDVVSNFVQRPQGDGAFDSRVFEAPRVVSWAVSVSAADQVAAGAALQVVERIAWNLRSATTIMWHSSAGDRSLIGKRDGGMDFDWYNDHAFRYQQHAICPDPFMYGETRQFSTLLPMSGGGMVFPTFAPADFLDFGEPGRSGQVQLFNEGTADAWPVFQVVGPIVGGLSITDTLSQRKLTYADDLSNSGQTLTITTRTGAVDVNGVDSSTGMTSAQWTPVPPGESRIFQFSTAGSPTQAGVLTGTLTDTYI